MIRIEMVAWIGLMGLGAATSGCTVYPPPNLPQCIGDTGVCVVAPTPGAMPPAMADAAMADAAMMPPAMADAAMMPPAMADAAMMPPMMDAAMMPPAMDAAMMPPAMADAAMMPPAMDAAMMPPAMADAAMMPPAMADAAIMAVDAGMVPAADAMVDGAIAVRAEEHPRPMSTGSPRRNLDPRAACRGSNGALDPAQRPFDVDHDHRYAVGARLDEAERAPCPPDQS